MYKYLTWNIYVMSWIEIPHLVLIRQKIMATMDDYGFRLVDALISYPLKPLGQMEQYFTESINAISFLKLFISSQSQLPWMVLVSDWLIPLCHMEYYLTGDLYM